MDQYMNPHESKHTIHEVMQWCRNAGLTVVNTIPKTIIGGATCFYSPDGRQQVRPAKSLRALQTRDQRKENKRGLHGLNYRAIDLPAKCR